jgi:hypothetical protein
MELHLPADFEDRESLAVLVFSWNSLLPDLFSNTLPFANKAGEILKNMDRILATALLLFLAGAAIPQTHLAGDISKINFDRAGNPFIVDRDIQVPAGATVVIKEGCVLVFNSFTGLQVMGRLKVMGSSGFPVIFSSINDVEVYPASRQLANPFDWNGILISREASGSVLQNFSLRYSVYGVKAQTTDLVIQNGIFRQNGQFHFTINEKIEYVQDNIPYSYGVSAEQANQPAALTTPDKKARDSGTKEKNPGDMTAGKKVLRFGGLGVGIAGLGIGTVVLVPTLTNYSSLLKTKKEWEDAQFAHQTEIDSVDAHYLPLFTDQKNKYVGLEVATIILESLGALGLIGCVVSFTF